MFFKLCNKKPGLYPVYTELVPGEWSARDLKMCWLSVGRWALRSDTAVLVIYAYENLEGNPYLLISGSRQNVGEIQNISVLAPCHFQQSYL